MIIGLILAFLLGFFPTTVCSYSIDKQLMEAAESPDMFDLFHVMPDGMVKLVLELDMLLGLDEYRELHPDKNTPHKRKATANIAKRWTNCLVYYEITETLDTTVNKKIIREAMAEFEKYSCLHFIENLEKPQRIIFKKGKMCLSAIGMQKGVQVLELNSGCMTKGIIIHEIGHAIGWFHEHSRPDRDRYVNVIENRIPSDFRRYYKRYDTDLINTYRIPYDYTSIMHYGTDTFPGSLVAKNRTFQKIMGQRDGLSFKDIKLLNVMYDCAKVMRCPVKDCGDGFQLYKRFNNKPACQCWCDSGNLTNPLMFCRERKTTVPPPVPTISPTTDEYPTPMECMDVRPSQDCEKLKNAGKCMSRMVLMKTFCAKTCGFCAKGDDICMDHEMGCGPMAVFCNDPGLRETMSETCKASCNLCPKLLDPCEIHQEMFEHHPLDRPSTNNKASRVENKTVLWLMPIYYATLISVALMVFTT